MTDTQTFSRTFAMPSAWTFEVWPIANFVQKYTRDAEVIVEPFAGRSQFGTHRNDLNADAPCESHMDAVEYLERLVNLKVVADLVLFDPPYSPRQIAEHYNAAGRTCTMEDTQIATMLAECRDHIRRITKPGSVVLSFGWNSLGMGRQWERLETLLVNHGGAHNDTICVADRCISVQGWLI